MRWADDRRREIKIQRYARFLMTISNTLNTTALPAMSPKPANRPAATVNPLGTAPAQTGTPQPSPPAGLVGQHINTTA
jgi:hypothetical protein